MQKEKHRVSPESLDVFSTFYEDYRVLIYSFILSRVKDRQLAEDLTSDTFLKAIEFLKKNNQEMEKSVIKYWLFRIAHNTMISHFRYMKNRKSDQLVEGRGSLNFDSFDTSGVLDQEDISAFVKALMSGLRVSEKNLLYARLWEGKTYKEISDETGENLNTLKTRMYKSLKKIRGRKHLSALYGYF